MAKTKRSFTLLDLSAIVCWGQRYLVFLVMPSWYYSNINVDALVNLELPIEVVPVLGTVLIVLTLGTAFRLVLKTVPVPEHLV